MDKLKLAFNLLKKTVTEWTEDKVPRLGAALAYYTVFSLAPLILIAIAIAGFFFGEDAARGQIIDELRRFLGAEFGDATNELLENARRPGAGIVATIIGVGTLLFGASGVFGQLKDAMNTIWEVQPKPGRGVMAIVKERFLSFTMVLGIGFLLLVSLVISAALSAGQKYLFGDELALVWQIVNQVVSFGIVTLLFALMFKVLPDVDVAWRDVWVGAVVTALLFVLGKFLIGLYIGRSAPESSYGAAGSVIVILLWVYYSAQILFFGAEFTQVYANAYGSHIKPAPHAVPVTEEMRAQQGMPSKETLELGEGRRTPKPVWRKGGANAPAVITVERTKSLEKQRYVAAIVGFLAAVFLGGLKATRDQNKPL